MLRAEVCALSGLLPTRDCGLTRFEWFIPGTVPTEEDNFYQTFEIDTRTGLLADQTTPDEFRQFETFIVLPQEARDWAVAHGLRQPPPGAGLIVPDQDAGLRLLEPDPYTVFELSPILPVEAQRIRLTVGGRPGTQQVTYTLNGRELGTVAEPPWALWWPLELGAHELTATATLADGTTETTPPLYFSVVQDDEPASRTVESGG
jgi:membrane carboxypeptidase/penicillin-binding protein PbpC